MMIATTIEQGERLIQAGIPKKSADMCYIEEFITEGIGCVPYKRTWSEYPCVDTHEETDGPELITFPAWSLSALWDYIHNLDKTYDFPTTMSADELIEALVSTICYRLEHQ